MAATDGEIAREAMLGDLLVQKIREASARRNLSESEILISRNMVALVVSQSRSILELVADALAAEHENPNQIAEDHWRYMLFRLGRMEGALKLILEMSKLPHFPDAILPEEVEMEAIARLDTIEDHIETLSLGLNHELRSELYADLTEARATVDKAVS